MRLTLKVWRQKSKSAQGHFESYNIEADEHMSFLEMLDVLNERLISEKKEPEKENFFKQINFQHPYVILGNLRTLLILLNGMFSIISLCLRSKKSFPIPSNKFARLQGRKSKKKKEEQL